jgi:HD-GYP domain-containing protein (c-di-GMP phosphodiesterase class II)
MRLVAIDELQLGMKLARAIFREDDGGILLRPNIELKSSYIDRIKELKYNSVYILDPHIPQNEIIMESIDEETRFKARGLLKKTADQLLKDEMVHTIKLKRIVTELVDQIFRDINIVYNMVDIRSYENYIYSHSVNVCIISLMIGMEMGFNRSEMENLGVGALLHDIGRIFIDPKPLDQFGHLESREYEQIKKHARLGYDTLKKKFEVNFLAAHVALQHHEREDGSGYPRGLTGKRIHRFAKIVAVADAYDAMTSQRVRGIPSHQAIREIKAEANVKFDHAVVQCFAKVVAPYLLGTVLQLNNGDIVLVTHVTRSECQVMIIKGSQEGSIFNLYLNPKLFVDKVLNVR